MKTQLTHFGWFGICPVFFSDPDGPAPLVLERHWTLAPLMKFSEAVFALCFFAISTVGLEPPGWPLKITGQLSPHREIDLPDEYVADE